MFNPTSENSPLRDKEALESDTERIEDLEIENSSQKTINSSVTLDDTYNGSIVKVKATSTITIPDNLVDNFSCVFRTFTGATATFLEGSNIVFDAPNGKILDPFKMVTLFKDGELNIYVIEGELRF